MTKQKSPGNTTASKIVLFDAKQGGQQEAQNPLNQPLVTLKPDNFNNWTSIIVRK